MHKGLSVISETGEFGNVSVSLVLFSFEIACLALLLSIRNGKQSSVSLKYSLKVHAGCSAEGLRYFMMNECGTVAEACS